jgi:outer membrane protein TolC/membrane protein DedA with SNARE-associated domain
MTHDAQYLLTHGALLLFAWILAQQAGAPIPSVPLLLMVGSLASSGRVNVASVIGASFGACLAADGFWYHVGRSGWSISNYVRPQTSGWANRALRIINRHAAGALVPAKFISCSNLAALVAGKTGIAVERFLIVDSVASFLWAGGYITIGYFVGNRVEVAVHYASAPLLILLGLLIIWFLAKLIWRGRRLRLHAVALATLMLLSWGAAPAPAQSSIGAAGATSYATTPSSALGQGPLIGSVPSGTATDEVLRLTLRDAMDRALKYNLGSIEGGENTRLARGQRLIALSQLLPQISAGVSENVEQVSASTLGIKTPLIPQIIGPYAYSTVEVSASQTLFSYESIQRFRAARTAEQAANLNYQDVLDAVTLTVGNAYLQVIQTSSHIEAQEAQVRNAKALYDQALDQFKAGTAPRIDVTRTEVQLHTEEYNLSVARNNFAVTKLALGRAIGLPLGQRFELADELPYSDINPPTLEIALAAAYHTRSDFRAALDTQKAAAQTLAAAKGERYPVVAMNGSYGDIGETFDHSHGVFAFQAGISVPIFTGGRIKGDITQAESALHQRKAEAENLRGQIDYEVRTAFLNLNAAKEQVDVAQRNVELANESLARSKDRFASGVTDSVEVVQAEQALASANDQYIASLYNHNFAKLSLARALGVARTSYSQYLGGK